MGRPKKDDAEKRLQLNIRVKPTTKGDIEAYANREGCTVSAKAEQLIEDMLRLSDGADSETIDLLTDIVQEIQTVQSETNGVWHKDLKTWAAVTEIFKGSPIKKKKPDIMESDPAVKAAWIPYLEIAKEKQSLIMMMQKLGIAINADPVGRYGGLAVGGIFGSRPPLKHREIEAQKISEIEDEGQRAKAEAIFSMIVDADERGQAAHDAWSKAVDPYYQQQAEGRRIYKDYRRKIALDTLSKGGFPDIEDL